MNGRSELHGLVLGRNNEALVGSLHGVISTSEAATATEATATAEATTASVATETTTATEATASAEASTATSVTTEAATATEAASATRATSARLRKIKSHGSSVEFLTIEFHSLLGSIRG
jgi:hypothetical protein